MIEKLNNYKILEKRHITKGAPMCIWSIKGPTHHPLVDHLKPLWTSPSYEGLSLDRRRLLIPSSAQITNQKRPSFHPSMMMPLSQDLLWKQGFFSDPFKRPPVQHRHVLIKKPYWKWLSNHLAFSPRLSFPHNSLEYTLWWKWVGAETHQSPEDASPFRLYPLRDISTFDLLKLLSNMNDTYCGVTDNHR